MTDDSVTVVAPGSATPDGIIGAAARFERANADGGVNGRRILFEKGQEDTGEPTSFALLPAGDARDGSVPVFGAPHDDLSFCGVGEAFAVNGCQAQPSNIWGTLVSLAAGTAGTAFVVPEATPDGDPFYDQVAASFEAAGFTVVTFDESVGDSESAGLDFVVDADPDLVVYLSGSEGTLEAATGLRDAGYEGAQTFRTGYTPAFAAAASEAGLDGVTVLTDFAPFESADENPIVQRLIDDVREYEETEGMPETPLSGEVAAGYWSADAFLVALDATGSDLTVERFLQTADDDFEWRAEGTAGPATWPRNRDVPVPCGALVEVAGDGTFEVAVPYSCGRNLP
ncbi:MAG: ABC transporter substrate-binding protein [Acidimicrobiia bacterium]|nr:ABC transporter substrate-binding protein [Acidimicrobiia bacterium]